MSTSGKEPELFPMELQPHQTQLVNTVLNLKSNRIIVLRGDAGLGKSTALTAVVHKLLHDRPTARALYLAPNLAMQSWFVDKLCKIGTPNLGVDRYIFREILDSTIGEEIWPRGVVVVMSHNFAIQNDILESLVVTDWDLIIVDEAHRLAEAHVDALHKLEQSTVRIVLAGRITSDPRALGVFPAKETTAIEWPCSLVLDQGMATQPVLHEVPFCLSTAELNLRATVVEIFELQGGGTGAEALKATVLLRSLESSPVALESVLHRVVQEGNGQEITVALLDSVDEEEVDGTQARIDRTAAEKAAVIAAHALEELEAIDIDSKLNAFGKLMTRLIDGQITQQSICVLTDYVSTLYYLATEIESRGMTCHVLHGSIPVDDRGKVLQRFSDTGGILLATFASLNGVDLREVTDLVLYDTPARKGVMWVVMSRFTGSGQSKHLNIYVLAPPSGIGGLTDQDIAHLRHELMHFADQEQPNS